MEAGGRLTIETANTMLDDDYAARQTDVEAGNYVLLSVTDNGAGMPPEIVEKVFDPFFSTKEAGSGSGLGLSMVYGFVKQSGGHVAIYSEPGRGTTVNLYLPKAPDDGTAEDISAPAEIVAGDEVVLLVEDHPQLRRRARRVLDELGYRVTEAENGDSALKILEARDDIELLFTDIVMPGALDGAALANEARKLRPGIRILFTTGYAEQAQIAEGLLEQGGELLRKPYTKAQLSAKIRALLD